jgi:hypothetical protein
MEALGDRLQLRGNGDAMRCAQRRERMLVGHLLVQRCVHERDDAPGGFDGLAMLQQEAVEALGGRRDHDRVVPVRRA